ncbi:hypothetical protein [Anaerorhabdus sp.]|uniref:hypothetical protein n=1 Tax=Anaerorhabdus sp. TaxID=1872524 RepID=UPI002FC876BD
MLVFEMIVVLGVAVLNEKVVKLGAKAVITIWGFYQYLKDKKNNLHFDSRLFENEENRLLHSKWIVTIRKLVSILIYGFCIVQLIEISNRSVWIDMASQVTINSIIRNELESLRLLNLELIVGLITAVLMNLIIIFLYQIKREEFLDKPVSWIIFLVLYITVAIFLLATNIQQFCWMFL